MTVFDDLVDPECLEAHACCEAFALATDLQVRRIRVATDCLATVNNLSRNFMGSYSAIVIRDIKQRMMLFDDPEVVHEARESNFEAHDLAKASLATGRHIWLSTTPTILFVPNILEV